MNMFCVKVGVEFPAEYVNNLWNAVKASGVTLYCITDDPKGVDKDVVCLSTAPVRLKAWWWKLTMFNPEFYPEVTGPVFYTDLDVVIVNGIRDYLEYKSDSDLLTIQDPRRPMMNSSVMRWNRDELGWVWEEFTKWERVSHKEGRKKIPGYVKDGVFRRGDQEFLQGVVEDKDFYPKHWSRSYKLDVQNKGLGDTKIVVFHGSPRPHQLDRNHQLFKIWKSV